jgi:hypothetical protein
LSLGVLAVAVVTEVMAAAAAVLERIAQEQHR